MVHLQFGRNLNVTPLYSMGTTSGFQGVCNRHNTDMQMLILRISIPAFH